MTQTSLIQIFAKPPVEGLVKTRLSSLLPSSAILGLYMELLEQTLLEVAKCRAAGEIWEAWNTRDQPFLAFGLPVRLQKGANLGERMSYSLTDGLSRFEKVILIGCDLPLVDAPYLHRALESLDDHECVIGPAEDGGYGLVGVRRSIPDIFEDVSWGSKSVLEQTCSKLNAQSVNFSLLPLVWDLDRPIDFERYMKMKKNLRF